VGEGQWHRQMNHKSFVAELRRRFDVRRDGAGNTVVGVLLDYGERIRS